MPGVGERVSAGMQVAFQQVGQLILHQPGLGPQEAADNTAPPHPPPGSQTVPHTGKVDPIVLVHRGLLGCKAETPARPLSRAQGQPLRGQPTAELLQY